MNAKKSTNCNVTYNIFFRILTNNIKNQGFVKIFSLDTALFLIILHWLESMELGKQP